MLAYKLAESCGCMSPERLLGSMTSAEITSWHAYDSISPIGGRRLDYLAAAIMEVIANSQPFNKKKYRLGDFLLKWRDDPEDRQNRLKKAWGQVKGLWKNAQKHG